MSLTAAAAEVSSALHSNRLMSTLHLHVHLIRLLSLDVYASSLKHVHLFFEPDAAVTHDIQAGSLRSLHNLAPQECSKVHKHCV